MEPGGSCASTPCPLRAASLGSNSLTPFLLPHAPQDAVLSWMASVESEELLELGPGAAAGLALWPEHR